MTDPSTDHAAAIRHECADLDAIDSDDVRAAASAILDHADALADALEAERARTARLLAAYLDAEEDSVTYALPEHNANNPHQQVAGREWIRALREAHLDPGDLDDPEATS